MGFDLTVFSPVFPGADRLLQCSEFPFEIGPKPSDDRISLMQCFFELQVVFGQIFRIEPVA